VTREGYLFVWNTPGKASQNQAYSWHQDNWHTGRYGMDTRPPSVPTHVSVTSGAGTDKVCWRAPGDDWMQGTAAKYEISAFAQRPTPESFSSGTPLAGAPTPASAGTHQCATVSTSAPWIGIRAIDDSGLVGYPAGISSQG
jgi:hypothetical protein